MINKWKEEEKDGKKKKEETTKTSKRELKLNRKNMDNLD